MRSLTRQASLHPASRPADQCLALTSLGDPGQAWWSTSGDSLDSDSEEFTLEFIACIVSAPVRMLPH